MLQIRVFNGIRNNSYRKSISFRIYDSKTDTIYSNRSFFHSNIIQCWIILKSKQPTSILIDARSEEHTSELQSRENLVCRLLLEKKKKMKRIKSHWYTD